MANSCPNNKNRWRTAQSPHGGGGVGVTGMSSGNGPRARFDARREAREREQFVNQSADDIINTIGANYLGGFKATASDIQSIRSMSKQLRKWFAGSLFGAKKRAEMFDMLGDLLDNTTSGEDSRWLGLSTKMEEWFTNEKASLNHWAMRFFRQGNRSMAQQDFVRAFRAMNAEIQGHSNRFLTEHMKPLLRSVDPIARRLGYSNYDTAVVLGEYANCRAVKEKNDRLLEHWRNEIALEMAKSPDVRNNRIIHEYQKYIDDLLLYRNDPKPPKDVVTCGYTDAEAAVKMKEILDMGVSREEAEAFSNKLVDWNRAILESRINAGLVDPRTILRFPDYTYYVPFQNRFQNVSGAVNDTHPYHPGTYHYMNGNTAKPDSAFTTTIAYSYRAANELGMQRVGTLLAAAAQHDKLYHTDSGIRMYKRSDIERMKYDPDPETRAFARSLDEHGGMIVDVPDGKGGSQRMHVCWQPGWEDPVTGLTGRQLNAALVADSKIGAGLNKVAVANSWFGQMYTRTPFFSMGNSFRDFFERSSHLANLTTFDEAGQEVSGMSLLGAYFANEYRAAKMLRDALGGRLDPDSVAKQYWDEYVTMGLHQEYTPGMSQGARTLDDVLKKNKNVTSPIQKLLRQPKYASLRAAIASTGRNASAVIGKLDAWNDYFNNISSFNQFITLREAGISADRAGTITLDSMNMANKGKLAPALSVLFPFVKPTLQSAGAMARSLGMVYDPRGFWKGGKNGWKYMLGATAALAMLRPLMEDSLGTDPETGQARIDGLTMDDLSRSIVVGIGGGDYVKLPLGFGPLQVVAVIVHGVDRIAKGQMTVQDFAAELLFTTAKNMVPGNWPQFNFSEDPASYMAQLLSPTVISPVVSTATNKGFFGNTITNADENGYKSKAEQGRTSTAPVYHNIAKEIYDATGIDLAPEQVRSILNGYAIGPLRFFRSWLESNETYRRAKKSGNFTDDNLWLAAARGAGGSMFVGNVGAINQSMFYKAADYYHDLVKKAGIKFTSEEYGSDHDARVAYQTKVLQDAGFTPEQIADIMAVYETERQIRNGSREFNESTRVTWLTSPDNTEVKEALEALAQSQSDIYTAAVNQLNYYMKG